MVNIAEMMAGVLFATLKLYTRTQNKNMEYR
jgi:hypothetical protein